MTKHTKLHRPSTEHDHTAFMINFLSALRLISDKDEFLQPVLMPICLDLMPDGYISHKRDVNCGSYKIFLCQSVIEFAEMVSLSCKWVSLYE